MKMLKSYFTEAEIEALKPVSQLLTDYKAAIDILNELVKQDNVRYLEQSKELSNLKGFICHLMDCVKLITIKHQDNKEYDVTALEQYLDQYYELKEKYNV